MLKILQLYLHKPKHKDTKKNFNCLRVVNLVFHFWMVKFVKLFWNTGNNFREYRCKVSTSIKCLC